MYRLLTLALTLVSAPAFAQMDPGNRALIVQGDHVVGYVHVGLPPGPCRSVEHWFLFQDYAYPSDRGDGFTVAPDGAADESLERFLDRMYGLDPHGTLVTVEVTETSAACR